MIKNLLLKALNSLSPEEKKQVRKALEDNEVVEEKVSDTKDDTVEAETEETGTETKETETKEKTDDKKDEETQLSEKEETETEEDNSTEPALQVESTEVEGNGIRIDQLVTKDELGERLSALEAKYNAIVEENTDLKNKLSAIHDKYEVNDFGNQSKKGIDDKGENRSANETFDSYSKQFM